MRKDTEIKLNAKTSEVVSINGDHFNSLKKIGIDGENLQGNIIFTFEDVFVDGVARIETIVDDVKNYIMANKVNESYQTPILSSLLKSGTIYLQLIITETEQSEGIPIFKSKMVRFRVEESINAEIEQPEEYPEWIDVANAKIIEIDTKIAEANNLDLDVTKEGDTATITVTKKDGTTKSETVKDGKTGPKGDPGITPHIENGYWYIGEINTNVRAEANSIVSIEKTGTEGLIDEYTITFTDNTTFTYYVSNGKDGIDGYTPRRGIDYWTNQDKTEIVSSTVNQVESDLQPSISTALALSSQALNRATSAEAIAKGANQAKSYDDYYDMVTAVNSYDDERFISGQILNIRTMGVPDLWVYSVEQTSIPYTYTTDEVITNELATNGYIQVGYYKLSPMETQKVNLTDYVPKTAFSYDSTTETLSITI